MSGVPVSLHGGHTTVFDGVAGSREMVAAARAAGMEVYGLSEHFYRPRVERLLYDEADRARDWGRAGWPAFAEEVVALKEEHRGDGLEVLLGAEVEFLPGYRDWTVAELEKWPLDYVVISVHFVSCGDEAVAFDFSEAEWSRAAEAHGGAVGLHAAYYDHVIEALGWGVGDVLGHLDVIKIFGPAELSDPEISARVDRVLELCAEAGVVLDLNARGLLKPCAEVYPSVPILERALERGVDVVPGDDAHEPGQVAKNLDRAVAHARAAGYRRIALPRRLGGRSWAI